MLCLYQKRGETMADGNLIFDTKIDQSGFVKGIKSIGKGVIDFAAD